MRSDAFWIHYDNWKGQECERSLVVASTPLLWHVVSRVMAHWPFYHFYDALSKYYATTMESAPQVRVAISREQEAEIKDKLWGRSQNHADEVVGN